MTISDKHFSLLWGDALGYDGERDAWISDHALGWEQNTDDPYQDPIDVDSDAFRARVAYLARLWDAAHMSVRDICAAAGLTQTALAQRFCISWRTVQNWCGSSPSSRKCPDYVRLMMLECLGLLPKL